MNLTQDAIFTCTVAVRKTGLCSLIDKQQKKVQFGDALDFRQCSKSGCPIVLNLDANISLDRFRYIKNYRNRTRVALQGCMMQFAYGFWTIGLGKLGLYFAQVRFSNVQISDIHCNHFSINWKLLIEPYFQTNWAIPYPMRTLRMPAKSSGLEAISFPQYRISSC